MKVWNAIWKTILALAAIAGIIYVLAQYGDKIVAWCKKILGLCKGCCEGDVIIEEAETVACEEAAVEEAVAVESDFEG